MKSSLDNLLRQLSYNKKNDTLIHIGDIITKGPHTGSLAVLSFMSKNNITGIRGNHDQKVIEWRAWIEWIRGLEAGAGSRWLVELEEKWEEGNLGGELEKDKDTEAWVGTQMSAGRKDHEWWTKVPRGWKLFSDHYRVARAMSKADYEYLLSLPLMLHVPSEHAFLVHAGLLPYDPTISITSKRQPLAHLPRLSSGLLGGRIPMLRNAQELAILDDIKPNKNPWVVLNMRNLRKDNTISRKTNKGKAWTEAWNGMMSRCDGFEPGAKGSLPCHPSTVVYGHTASRGLDVHRWTVGLDTGCVYGRQLTALILGKGHPHQEAVSLGARESSDLRSDDENEEEEEDGADDGVASIPGAIPFGDSGRARLVSARCHKSSSRGAEAHWS
ncbi:Metallo-dependent phosphatase [Russula earlei]|uniref:Metallo-dependent phosphatase n=1 Tax=Russula earlei TaxID=71964 RepID=A0ACC0UKB4_9AGAM|nr:Metallo-dependent phosphatase [Russula earlei]